MIHANTSFSTRQTHPSYSGSPPSLLELHRRAAEPALVAIQRLAGDDSKPPAVRRMAAYIREYLFDPDLDFSGIAASARCPDLDTETIAQQFTEHAGEAPLRYVEARRREVARGLIKDASLSVIQVAYLVGFPSIAAFWRAMSRPRIEDPCRLQLIQHHREAGQGLDESAGGLVDHLACELSGPGFHALIGALLRRFGQSG